MARGFEKLEPLWQFGFLKLMQCRWQYCSNKNVNWTKSFEVLEVLLEPKILELLDKCLTN
jgi:hypothetical protein